MRKCALCSWPLGQRRDQIPGHWKAPLIFIKSHRRLALRFCSGGEQGALLNNTTATLRSEQDRLFFLLFVAWLLIRLHLDFFFYVSILVAKEQLKSEKRRGYSIFKCPVPWVSLWKSTCTKMLATDPVTKDTEMISKRHLPSTLTRQAVN